jgi:glycosyltransferase involved in cell wall biosynthesis
VKLWLVNHYAKTPDEPGGSRHFGLARELSLRGHEVTVVASSFDHRQRQECHLEPGETSRVENVAGVTFLWLRTPAYSDNSWRRARNMFSFALRVWRGAGMAGLSKPELILGSSPHLFAAWAAERLALRYGIPFVLEVRDLWPQGLIDLGIYKETHPAIRLLSRLERHLYTRAHKIIALMPGASDHIKAKGISRDKVFWLPNGIDLEAVPPLQPPLPSPVLTIAYAGAHGLVNGLDYVLEAASILKRKGFGDKVCFRLIGDGPLKSQLQCRAREQGLDLVKFEPPVPKKQIYSVLSAADAFLVVLKPSPIWRWGISLNKLHDYLACGRPVLFGVDSPNNPVREAQAGLLFSPESSDSLVDAVLRLMETPREERILMGMRGRQFVEEHHSFAVLAARLETILENILTEAAVQPDPLAGSSMAH